MNEENKNIIYTAEDIKRYLTGRMTPAEMHAIELAALDDPLLAEAMEGFELMEQKDWSTELASLKEHFTKKEKKQAVVIPLSTTRPFKRWKAAAAVLVAGTAAFTAYLFTGEKENSATQEIATLENVSSADNKNALGADSTSPTVAVISADTATQPNAQTTTAAEQSTNARASTSFYADAGINTNVKPGNDSTFIYRPDNRELLAMKDDKPVSTSAYDLSTDDETKVGGHNNYNVENVIAGTNTQNNAVSPANTGNAKSFSEQAKTSTESVTVEKKQIQENEQHGSLRQNQFSGSVLSPDGKPVSFASIEIPQQKQPVYSDVNGHFNFKSNDSLLNITVTSTGYNSRKVVLNKYERQNNIILEPQLMATEIIASAKPSAAKRNDHVNSDSLLTYNTPEPVGGWMEYNKYLMSNLRYPQDAKQKNLHGEVELAVKLSNNGDVSQIKVDKSLCPQCDAEAIRLVKEGPKFDVKNTKKKKVKIRVKF